METDNLILKYIMKRSKPDKNLLNKVKRPVPLIMKTYYIAIFIKTVWCWHKDRQISQWYRIEDPQTYPCTYGHLFHDRSSITEQWVKKRLFNKLCWHNWIFIWKKTEFDSYFVLCINRVTCKTKDEFHKHKFEQKNIAFGFHSHKVRTKLKP